MNKVILVMLLAGSFLNAADVKKEFYENGSLKYKITYDTKTKSTCTIQTYYRNGSLKKELVFTDNTDKRCNSFK